MSDVKKRRNISDKTIKLLYGKSGNKCAMYGCNNTLVGNNNENLGEICHINDLNPNQIRYDSSLDEDYLNSEENLILLCSGCHTKIDAKENADQYTVEYLKEMKCRHERFVQEAINKKTIIQPPSFLKKYNFEKIAKRYVSVSKYKYRIKKKDIPNIQIKIRKILEDFLSMNQEFRYIIYKIMLHTNEWDDCVNIGSLYSKVDIDLGKYGYILKNLETAGLIIETEFTDERSCIEDNNGDLRFVHENYQYKALHGSWYLQTYGKLIYTVYKMFENADDFYDFMVSGNIKKIEEIL